MSVQAASITVITTEVEAARRFYDRYFDTWSPFDCGWYVLVRLGKERGAPEVGFTSPRDGVPAFAGGSMLNLVVDDVDALHARMQAAGETIAVALADNPWGDRGFGVVDPAGLMVYCHKAIPASAEFRPFIQQSPDHPRGT